MNNNKKNIQYGFISWKKLKNRLKYYYEKHEWL